ncbi:MAG: citrate synthase [Deltaproteobacteria bacterium]|nr:citrate synthase [Deltaproteobacteria bacterium]
MAEQQFAEVTLPDGKKIKLPVVVGTENEHAIDITSLRSQSGYITIDEGYANTGACFSSIGYIDGDAGILRYRGYPIEELAEKSTFLETAYLLIFGELPTQKSLNEFTQQISRHMLLHEDMKRFYDGFPRDAHPMAILASTVAALYTFHQDWEDPKDREKQDLNIIRLMAKLPTLAAFAYKKSIGEPFIYPDASLSYCANYLNMMFRTPHVEFALDPDIVHALDLLLILHADHEQNCSTSTVRLVGSSLSNLYASISAGIGALWGPLHGGANQKVIEMLQSIARGGGDVKKYVEMAKSKDSAFRLMGFGHRVYKNYDPRAKILKSACDKVLAKLPVREPLLQIAQELESVALSDPYFIERKLYPNVDFYSGIIYHALGIPVNGFTAMFALGRLPGWIAQWREMLDAPAFKIGRPRQIYTGPTKRDYVAIGERK